MDRNQIKYKKMNINLIVGIVLTLIVTVPVIISLLWQYYNPNEINYSEILQAPSLQHVFGTDDYGRDIYSRVMNGAATTFAISLFTVICGAFVGTIIGALTGYFGGAVDEILMRINDCLASFPSILLALVVVSILDKGTWNICIALGLVFIPSFSRIMRSEFIKEKNKDYVLNARLMGAGHFRVIFIHIFPNTLPILFSSLLVGLNNAVLAEAGLSYLGLGVQPPDPSLGRMLSDAKTFIFGAPWYEFSTCFVMIFFILGITLISENIGVSGINPDHVRSRIDKIRKKENNISVTTGIKLKSKTEETAKENDENGPVLCVNNLHVGFIEDNGISDTIRGISFELNRGEILGFVGESGSGKSLTAMSIMGILNNKAVITEGSILLDMSKNDVRYSSVKEAKNLHEIKLVEGTSYAELTLLEEDEFRYLRGGKLAYVFQEPMTSLNPVQKIGVQIDEVLDIHASHLTESEQRKLVLEAMEDTGLQDVDKLYDMYPHELSGGMRQRVIISMALIAHADIIIADEPTTALDAGVAEVILDIFKKINRKYGTSIIIISHDLRVIGRLADRALIMREGEIVETIDVLQEDVRKIPVKVSGRKKKTVDHLLKGRKEYEPTIEAFSAPETEYGTRLLKAAFTTKSYTDNEKNYGKKHSDNEIIVSLSDVSVSYKSAKASKKKLKKVIDGVSIEIQKGRTTGFVGENGCGKTTLVKAIAGLQKYVDGEIQLKCERPAMVFQDPYSSLNPAYSVERILMEPLLIGKTGLSKKQMKERVADILKRTELDESIAHRKISELSGGQRQRIAIALTLIQKKELIILDEPVSALDVTIQEQILELLDRLRKEYGLTYILISHDKRLISRFCDRVFRVADGKLSEE